MGNKAVCETCLPNRKPVARGKVRDIYDLGRYLLIVATDRISAFDVVLPSGIPHKGRVLNQISSYWFRTLEDIASHHMVATDLEGFPGIPRPPG